MLHLEDLKYYVVHNDKQCEGCEKLLVLSSERAFTPSPHTVIINRLLPMRRVSSVNDTG